MRAFTGFMHLLVLAWALWPACSWAQVQVRQIDYEGWSGSVEIANGEARLVVVPAIGRIMHYGFKDGANILWTDADLHGKVLPREGPFEEGGQYVWTNFGGDKVWPNQQSEFEQINGHSWPPDHAFDGGGHTAELLADGVRITSPISSYNGARSVREIRLAATGTRVSIGQRIEKVRPAARSELEPLRYTIWNVTQIRPPAETLFPLNPHSHFAEGYFLFGFEAEAARRNFRREGLVGIFVPDAEKSQKAGTDGERWLAGIVEQTVIAEFFRRDSTQPYPDGGLSAEVYTCPDYTELELLSPWVPLGVGEVLDFPIAWELHRLPEKLKTSEQKRRAALEWLWSRPY